MLAWAAIYADPRSALRRPELERKLPPAQLEEELALAEPSFNLILIAAGEAFADEFKPSGAR